MVSSNSPITINSRPPTTTERPPSRTNSRGAIAREKAPMATVIGRKARPVAAAPNPATSCRDSPSRNWNPKSAPTMRNCVRLAPHTRRSRRKAKGSNGSLAIHSRRTKAPISAVLSTAPATVDSEPQPSVGVRVMVKTASISPLVISAAPLTSVRRPIEALPGWVEAISRHQQDRRNGRGYADRHIDQENPVPAEGLGDQSAGQQPDRGSARPDEAVHPDRPGALALRGEQRDDHSEDH